MNGTVSSCYATGSVTGYKFLGGLCGDNNFGTIINCYVIGSVSGNEDLGDLCGSNGGTISNCFWDVETSGIGSEGDNNHGAIGKTTAQMQ